MIQKNYQKEIPSPFMGSRQYDVQRPDHPVQDEVRKFIGRYSIVAEVESDENTLELMGIPGLVSFLTTLRDGEGRILSQGRGSAVISQNSRYISKMVNLAFGSSFVDASVRCAKVLDTLRPDRQNVVAVSNQPKVEKVPVNSYRTTRDNSYEPATEKQKNYLLKLLSHSGNDYEPDEISRLSKSDAAERIGFLVSAGESRINY